MWVNCAFILLHLKNSNFANLIEFLHGRFSEQATHCAMAKKIETPITYLNYLSPK